MFEEFINHINSIDPNINEIQLEVITHRDTVLQVFENSFCVHQNQTTITNKTNYNLMGASMRENQIFLYTLQGLVGWDILKNEENFFMKTEEIFCGDFGPQSQVSTAHNKTIMIWDSRFNKPINCVLAHSLQITSCKFNDTAMYLVTSAQDNCSRVLHTYLPECLQTISMSKVEHTTHAQFMKDSKHIIVQTLNNPISLWNWSQSEMVAQYQNSQLKNKRFYLPPQIIYDDIIPTHLITASQDGVIGQYEIMKPYKVPKLQKLNDDKPVRFTCGEGKLYAFVPGLSKLDIYNHV